MKRNISILIIIVLLITVATPLVISYAFDESIRQQDDFLKVNSETVLIGENIELVLDLNKVRYDNFKLEITSNLEMGELKTDSNVEIKNEEDEISMSIEKGGLNISEIAFTYNPSENIKIGDNIELTIKVTNLENNDDSESRVVVVSVIEKNDTFDGKINIDPVNNPNVGAGNSEARTQIQQNNDSNKSVSFLGVSIDESYTSSTKLASSNVSSDKETKEVTYNGDCNNYLESLTVNGCEFTQKFSKENSTYFINLEEDLENVIVNAIPESDLASVNIYGNENVVSGSKILISITAENGNTRTYRIFVI